MTDCTQKSYGRNTKPIGVPASIPSLLRMPMGIVTCPF
jgi:hypothetical protein